MDAKKELEEKFDDVQKDVEKKIKERIEDINVRLKAILDGISGLKSTSTNLWNEMKVRNRHFFKINSEEIEDSLKKIEDIVILGPLDEVVDDMEDLEDEKEASKKASISDLIENISKKLCKPR